MAKSWKWKANLQMSPAGASGPAEADNELVSRFLMYGDFTVDLDASFGAAANLDTSGLAISVCGKELSFDSDRTASNADQTDVKLRVQRIGDELQLIRGDEAKVMALAPGVGGSPTHWRLWWRSRDVSVSRNSRGGGQDCQRVKNQIVRSPV